MRVEQQPAFILHARPYRETSLMLEVFSREHGRVGLVARGVRREKSRIPRGLLQPLQPVLIGWVAKGELGTLTGVDAASASLRPVGDALLAAMYVNELVLRLSGRNDAHPPAFDAYAHCLARLAQEPGLAWTLRRFERDFLAGLGYALALSHDVSGQPVDADRDYAYDPASGAMPWQATTHWTRVRGAALLALDRDECPPADLQVQLRRLIRAVVRDLLGSDLNAWALAVRPGEKPRP